jgi:hypothetical protein
MSERPDHPFIRRIITGHDANNTAKVLIDAPATNDKYPDFNMISTLIWATDSSASIRVCTFSQHVVVSYVA